MKTGSDTVRLIAHRGGVVDEKHPENSFEALEAAILHGYWMVEIDIRPTADGVPVVYHESLFPGGDQDWLDIHSTSFAVLREVSEGQLLQFADYLERVGERIGLMINLKDHDPPRGYLGGVEALLEATGLLRSCWFIGVPSGTRHFLGKGRVSVNPRNLSGSSDYDVAARDGRFLFGHGRDLDGAAIRTSFRARLDVVPSINEYHYLMAGEDPMERGAADIARLLAAGVRVFQIDSSYEDGFASCGTETWRP